MTARAAYLDAGDNVTHDRCLGLLRQLLGLLRAQYMHYQNAHWEVKGDAFYGDHLLFQRAYESIPPQTDTLAEKMVGMFGSEAVEGITILGITSGWVHRWAPISCLHERSLASEADFQRVIKTTYEVLKKDTTLSLGLDDFLMAMANEHETHTYLIQQILAGRKAPKSIAASWRRLSALNVE